jgi:hypothetical protein
MNTETDAVKLRRLDGAQRAVHQRNPLVIKELNKSEALPRGVEPLGSCPEKLADTNMCLQQNPDTRVWDLNFSKEILRNKMPSTQLGGGDAIFIFGQLYSAAQYYCYSRVLTCTHVAPIMAHWAHFYPNPVISQSQD